MTSSYTIKRQHNYFQRNTTQRKPEFVEDRESAFFLGKLNKHHDREQVYNQLKRLTKPLNFYIRRFDMPNGGNGRGNKGFAFVHTRSREEARKIISMKFLRLGNQDCEVKPYGGRTSESNFTISDACARSNAGSEGRGTPDSGCVPVSTKFENPLKRQEIPENLEIRSRMNSGIQVSESGRLSDKISTRNVSESENNEETQEISLELSQKRHTPTEEYNEAENNYEPQPSLVISLNADSEKRDYWLEEQTNFVMTVFGENDGKLREFMSYCDYLMEFLKKSDNQTIQEVRNILSNQQTIGCM